MKYYLYNPKSNNGILPEYLKDKKYEDATKIDYQKFFDSLKKGDEVVLVGGDGTINYLINHVDVEKLKNKVYFKPAGTGNDFLRDIERKADEEIDLDPFIHDLPTVKVNGITAKFINGIGYGIDGYCCETADKMKADGYEGEINYAGIAIKGLLFHFKPKTATVTVDGKEYIFKKTWIAATMKGRFYGGGMMIAPAQDRKDKTVSLVTYMTGSKLKALISFPSIFKGEHVKKEKMVKVITGRKIKVSFDVPCALQIDGDTVLNVKEYEVIAWKEKNLC